jgi:O-antigen/teichoic acid export membrane protein
LRVFPELRLEPWRLDTVIFRKLFAYGSKLQISRVADSVNFQFDRIIVSKFVGIDYVMFADVGGRLLSRIRVLPLILLSSLIPAVSELQAMNQTERIRLAFDRSTKFLAFISVPLFVFAAAFAHPIVRIWLGSSFSIAAYTMQILALGYLFNVLTGSISFFSQGIGNLGAQMWTSIIQAATNIVLSIVLVFRIGYYGVMIGTLISLIVGAVLFVFAFNKILKGSLRSIVHILKLPLVASTISVFIAMIPSFFEDPSIHGKSVEALLLTVSGFVFISMYFVILRIGEYFDEWDAEFLLRISPKFSFFAQLILSKERGTRLIESQKRR